MLSKENVQTIGFWAAVFMLVIFSFQLGSYSTTQQLHNFQAYIDEKCPLGKFEYKVGMDGSWGARINVSHIQNLLNSTDFDTGEII